jgi:hypothetical protein
VREQQLDACGMAFGGGDFADEVHVMLDTVAMLQCKGEAICMTYTATKGTQAISHTLISRVLTYRSGAHISQTSFGRSLFILQTTMLTSVVDNHDDDDDDGNDKPLLLLIMQASRDTCQHGPSGWKLARDTCQHGPSGWMTKAFHLILKSCLTVLVLDIYLTKLLQPQLAKEHTP